MDGLANTDVTIRESIVAGIAVLGGMLGVCAACTGVWHAGSTIAALIAIG